MKKLLYKFLAFIGITFTYRNVITEPLLEEEEVKETSPYLFGKDQKIIEEYDDAGVIGTCGFFDTETGESTITGNMMERTIKFREVDGSIHIDRMWYPENS